MIQEQETFFDLMINRQELVCGCYMEFHASEPIFQMQTHFCPKHNQQFKEYLASRPNSDPNAWPTIMVKGR